MKVGGGRVEPGFDPQGSPLGAGSLQLFSEIVFDENLDGAATQEGHLLGDGRERVHGVYRFVGGARKGELYGDEGGV
jgi:hypothetical protein